MSYPVTEVPFHDGEVRMQARVGLGTAMFEMGQAVIRPAMPLQHREFFQSLQLIYIASVAADGQPFASVLTGEPGFVTSPDSKTLVFSSPVPPSDPLASNLAKGSPIGVLGLEHHTRRRNRASGRVSGVTRSGFQVAVYQSFGNCPQYIQTRLFAPRPAPRGAVATASAEGPGAVRGPLSAAAATLVTSSDTFFIASCAAVGDSRGGADMSHRGGKPGFVKVTELADGAQEVSFPDFAGNNMFNTLGNLMLDPRCGLLFVDYESGNQLQITGTARIEFDGPAVDTFPGAHRLVHVHVSSWLFRPSSLPLQLDTRLPVSFSPFLEKTGDWITAGAEAPDVWRPFTIARVVDETPTVRSIYFQPTSDSGPLPTYLPGQHIPLKLPGVPASERSYTLSDIYNDTYYRITVRRSGRVSTLLHSMSVGDEVLLGRPAGGFTLDRASGRPIALLSAGVGVTPMMAMLESLLPNNGGRFVSPAPLLWLHVARSPEEHVFGRRVRSLEAAGRPPGPPLLTHTWFTRAGPKPGRPTAADILSLSSTLDSAPSDMDWYLCGPDSFMNGMRDLLTASGVREEHIKREVF